MIIAGTLLGFVVFSLLKGELNMMNFIKHQLFISSDKSIIAQHILFQGLIQLLILSIFFLLFTKWRFKKYALAAVLFISAMDMILATRLNSPYTVYYQNFKSREIAAHARQFPDGFPVPGAGPLIDNKDTRNLAYQALWRNMNIFHKQVSYEGYNPLHLKGFEEMADNHARLFETILQNPLIYLSGQVSPLDSMAIHEQNQDFLKGRIYLEDEDYLMLKVEGLRLNVGDSIWIKSFSPVEVHAYSKTEDKALINLLQNNYFGWKATVDGQPADIITANMGFISVPVPAGEHEVLFSYDPGSVKVGLLISLAALLFGINYLGFSVIRRK